MLVHINDVLDSKNLQSYVHCLLEQVSAISPWHNEHFIKKLFEDSRVYEKWVEQAEKDEKSVHPKIRGRKPAKTESTYQPVKTLPTNTATTTTTTGTKAEDVKETAQYYPL